jgi:hypothetical protein
MPAIEYGPVYNSYIERTGAVQTSAFRASVREQHGNYYSELAIIRIDRREKTISCSNKQYAPTEDEETAINSELALIEFPHTVLVRDEQGLREAGAMGKLYKLFDSTAGTSCNITMFLERVPEGKGSGKYAYWSRLSTGEWVRTEHDADYIPFWKPDDKISTYGETIYIHEGVKPAEEVDRHIREKHTKWPFYEALKDGVHWGMTAGAYGAHRMDWEDLARQKPDQVIYICDNDVPGKDAAKNVSYYYKRSLKVVIFGDDFPPAFDLADDIPPSLFSKRTKKYKGPLFQTLLEPATYATTVRVSPEGKRYNEITTDFKSEWFATVKPDCYVHKDWPNLIYNAKEFNNKVAPFSGIDDTSRILRKELAGKAAVLKYLPNREPGIYGGGIDGIFINTHVPSLIRPRKGHITEEDIKPFMDFMTHFIEDKADLHEVFRWIATLVCRPGNRMHYGLLLVSETQGVGKGTLGEKILAPLLGEWNVSYPNEQSIVDSNFNGWLAHKTLAIIHEIYAGHNSKAYDRLKNIITDMFVEVNKKYVDTSNIECWCHILACSNSLRALKLDDADRRWLVPRISSDKRTPKYWEDLISWLNHDDGLSIIRAWLEQFLSSYPPVITGEPAPDSSMKREVIVEGYSAGKRLMRTVMEKIIEDVAANDDEARINGHKLHRNAFIKADALIDGKRCIRPISVPIGRGTFFMDKDLQQMVKHHLHEGKESNFLESLMTCRKVAKDLGFTVGKTQCRVDAYGKVRWDGRVLSLDPEISEMTPGQLYEKGVPLLNLDDYVEF